MKPIVRRIVFYLIRNGASRGLEIILGIFDDLESIVKDWSLFNRALLEAQKLNLIEIEGEIEINPLLNKYKLTI
jgi:hypothetical protein